MITKEKIRSELKDIRYYYSKKEAFDAHFRETGENNVLQTIAKYNEIIRRASPQLYEVYASLYIRGITQESAAEEMDYSAYYVFKLNNKLVKMFYDELNK